MVRSTLFIMLLCFQSVVGAHALEFEEVLKDRDPARLIDSLNENERREIVRQLGNRLADDPVRFGEILCLIAPWTTGNEDDDQDLQENAWALMRQEPHAETQRFRWMDCAAVNRTGYYRSAVLDPMFDLRSSYCTGDVDRIVSSTQFEAMETRIRAFDEDVREGLSNFDIRRYSYFPVRNAVRLANLKAARAMLIWQSGDQASARSLLGTAAEELNAVLENLDVINTRNGWRFRNELKFHAALYAWLSGETSEAELRLISNQLPTVDDPELESVRQAGLMDDIPASYVEQIYVERLLPGAQADDRDAECSQWRRRSYDPAALVGAVLACDPTDLIAFDECMVRFEAEDWSVRYAEAKDALSEAGVRAEVRRLQREVDRLIQSMNKSSEDISDWEQRLAVSAEIDPESGHTLFSATANDFTTSERQYLGSLFSRAGVGIDPLFLRPRAY